MGRSLSSRGLAGDNAASPWRRGESSPLLNLIKLTVGLSVSFLCLAYATHGTDWERVRGVLAGAHPGWLAATIILTAATHLVRVQRWRILLEPVGGAPFLPALSSMMIGFGATAVLPLRLGELVRPALLGRQLECGVPAAISSVVVERLFDTLLVILCLFAVSLQVPLPPLLQKGAPVLAVVATVGMASLVAAQYRRADADRLLRALFGWLPTGLGDRLLQIAEGFLDGSRALGDPRTAVTVTLYSVALWLTIASVWGASFLILGIDVPLASAALTTVVIVCSFIFLPQGPGFVGTWQAGCVYALQEIFHVPADQAVGFALLTWLVQMGFNMLAGGAFLAREGLSFRDLLQSSAAVPARSEP